MIHTDALFDADPHYCIDTNVIVSFLSETDDEYYGADIFPDHWQQIENLIASSKIVAPRQIERELEGHARKRAKVGPWLVKHRYMFRDIQSDRQLQLAKRIVNCYPAYAKTVNYLGDLEVMTLAGALNLKVITLELPEQQSGQKRPKIPNVCREFDIGCLSVSAFLREIRGRRDHVQ
jgi:hypothetical protein